MTSFLTQPKFRYFSSYATFKANFKCNCCEDLNELSEEKN